MGTEFLRPIYFRKVRASFQVQLLHKFDGCFLGRESSAADESSIKTLNYIESKSQVSVETFRCEEFRVLNQFSEKPIRILFDKIERMSLSLFLIFYHRDSRDAIKLVHY